MASETSTVYVVDGDPEVRESLTRVIQRMGLIAASYPSAETFLDECRDGRATPKCMVVAARLPGLSGLGLQQVLVDTGRDMPVIMISSCTDIPTVTAAMRAGAVDFLEKPINSQMLSIRIREAMDYCVRQQREAVYKIELSRQLGGLSARQREVFDLLLAGTRPKQIARRLGIGEKTVAKHRATILEKMNVDSVVELVRLFVSGKPIHHLEPVSAGHCT